MLEEARDAIMSAGAAAFVHERERLDQPARATRRKIPARDVRLELRHPFPGEAVFFGEGIEDHPAQIVAGGFVIAARIAETGNERERHDSKNIRRTLPR